MEFAGLPMGPFKYCADMPPEVLLHEPSQFNWENSVARANDFQRIRIGNDFEYVTNGIVVADNC